MRRSIAAVQVEHAIEKAIQAVQENRKPVIVFEETGEAFIRQFVNEEMLRIKEEIAKTNEGGNDALAGEMADQLAKRVSDLDIVSQIRMPVIRSEESRVGKEDVSKGRIRWSTRH